MVPKSAGPLLSVYHTLRHSLASFLVGRGENPTVVQKLMRHSNVTTTLGLYSHAPNQDRLTTQSDMIAAFFAPISLPKKQEGVGEGVKGVSANLPDLLLTYSNSGGQGRD